MNEIETCHFKFNMEGICRACLTKHEQADLLQYSEKNRRLFVYCTGLQVKRNDYFTFELCKECYINLKVACNFKKTCRNSDKKIKKYLSIKESGENVDIYSFLKHNEDSIKFRLPLYINNGNSTPTNRRDDDNESTCTSIQNFMTDILQELPDSEAHIIRQVIEEEADILEDSLDSHWLHDMSDSDIRTDFSFSPFSTPHTERNDKDDNILSNKFHQIEDTKSNKTHECSLDNIITKGIDVDLDSLDKRINCDVNKCVIDINLENALKNTAQKVMLDDLLATPPVLPNISSPATPLIKDILFGDMKEETTQNNIKTPKKLDEMKENMEVIDEFLNTNVLDDKTNESDVYNDINEIERYLVKPEIKSKRLEDIPTAKNKYCITNFYCKMCDRKFKNLVALKVHCAKYHKLKIPKENVARVRRKMICDYCGKIFSSSRCIIKHIENHKNPVLYECKRCSLKFDTKTKLRQHQSTHEHRANNNNVPKNHVCSVCGWACTSSSNYNIHIKRHFKIFMHSCEECGQGFYRKCDMDAHMRRHTGERPFQCSYCSKSFARHDALNRHVKRHTDERPFPCNFCKSTFTNAYDLRHHKENVKSCLKIQRQLAKDSNVTDNFVLKENVT